MKKRLTAIILFLVFLLILTYTLCNINSRTPSLRDGEALPGDIGDTQYALVAGGGNEDSLEWDFPFDTAPARDLTLTLADVGFVRVYMGDELLYESEAGETFKRTRQIVVPASRAAREGRVHLRVESAAAGANGVDILSNTRVISCKALLGGGIIAQRRQTLAFTLAMAIMGMFILSFAFCLILFFSKRTETYLLAISMVSLISAITCVFMTSNPLIPVSFERYTEVLPLVALFPTVVNVAIAFFLCKRYVPAILRRFLNITTCLILTAALVFLRIVMHISFYTLLRILLIAPVVWILSKAYAEGMWGAGLLLFGYAVADSFIIALYLINMRHIAPAGPMIVYMNLNYLSYLSTTLSALIVTLHRFAAKFRETEALSRSLAEINRTLDLRVEERTSQLAREQTRRWNLMANIIHDIRSPLFIIGGYLEQLHTSSQDDPMKAVMKRQLSNLGRLVEDLLMMAKLEDESCFYEEEALELGGELQKLYEDNAIEADRRNIRLNFDRADAPMMIWIDPARFRQAMQNLLDNAFNYTPTGGAIRLSAEVRGKNAVISVRDSGSGIQREDLRYVFERYYHANHANNPKSSGLGLSIAKEIIVHSHGEIAVESQKGEGTVFTITLGLIE